MTSCPGQEVMVAQLVNGERTFIPKVGRVMVSERALSPNVLWIKEVRRKANWGKTGAGNRLLSEVQRNH